MTEFDFGIRKPDDFTFMPEDILTETIVPRFERIVEKFPDRPALKDSNTVLTYREFNNSINGLANQIIEVIGKEKTPVAYLFNREMNSIIAMMALCKLGKPSVGLHPSNSIEQLQTFIEDSTADLLITSSEFSDSIKHITKKNKSLKTILCDDVKTTTKFENPVISHFPNELFGIFYTSGSTGKPKGVMIGHLYKSQSILYQTNGWFFSPSDNISLVTSVSYLASHPSVFGALLNGGLLNLFDIKGNSAQKALDWIVEEKLTIFRCTPSIFRNIFGLAPKGFIFSNLRFVTLGGEPITGADIELFKQHTTNDCTLVNNYSSTEAGTICHNPVHHDLPAFQGMLPAGYPAPGKEVLLLDDDGKPVNRGETGEVVVRSKYLNLGYWKQEELTAEKFHTDPIDPEYRIYSTGDLAQFGDNGILEVKGRKDTQVKIRGFRIQLEIVDSALRGIPGIRDAATIVHGDTAKGQKLISYVAFKKGESVPVNQIRKSLSTKVPGYMIPSRFIILNELPRTATGKLSRFDLPLPSSERPELSNPYKAPQPGIESEIAHIWKELLGIDSIGIDDNFFDLGGDSLLALEMSLSVEMATKKRFPQQFFKNPTIRLLRTLLEDKNRTVAGTTSFDVASFPPESKLLEEKHRKRKKQSKIKVLLTRKYSKKDFDAPIRYLDKWVRNYLAGLPFNEAVKWSVKWSKNPIVRNVFYHHRKKMFSQWLTVLGVDRKYIAGLFRQSILTNMFFNMPKPVKKQDRGLVPLLRSYRESKLRYWSSLGDIIENTPASELPNQFPMKGLENLEEAWRQGKGVIILSYHGAPHPGGFLPLTKILGIDVIPTISYQIPIRKSRYHDQKEQITETAAFTMNAEIALYGQKILQEGGVVNFASDTNDVRGRTYKVSMGNRVYQIKGGFAEMALNTGAIVIPFSRYCLPDGRLEMEFFPPLRPEGNTRQSQVENMIHAYAEFIEQSWRAHPDGLIWSRIKKHLERPVSD